MNKLKTTALLLTTTLLLTACGNSNTEKPTYDINLGSNTSTQPIQDSESSNNSTNVESGVTSSDHTSTSEGTSTLTFEDLSKCDFCFSSGAGGWFSEFFIEKDGYFHGNSNDSDMGDSGDGYPDGTRYVSSYSGHFTNLTKIDDYTYEMTLADVSYADELGTEELADDVKYIYSEATGIVGTEKFKVYLPGKTTSDLDEDVMFWYKVQNQDGDKLTTICLENEDQLEGMVSYDRSSPSEDAKSTYDSYKSSYDYFIEELANAQTTLEMNTNAQQRYRLADRCLNQLWILIKYNTDDTTFQTILEEQRAWLKKRDATGSELEGASMAIVDKMDTQAAMTMERCEQLVTYIK